MPCSCANEPSIESDELSINLMRRQLCSQELLRRRLRSSSEEPFEVFSSAHSDDGVSELEQCPEVSRKKEKNHVPPVGMGAPWRNWWVRLLWTVIMIVVFMGILLGRQFLSLILVFILKLAVFYEVLKIAHVPSREKRLPLFRLVSWYFFFATNYYFYGESMLRYFSLHGPFSALAAPIAKHHRFLSYSLYCVGFVLFVLSLKRRHYKFQFSQFAWTHMAILLIVVQGHAIFNCIFEGLIWFILPAVLVISNDVFAYIFGFFWGRTPLIRLSPKKTWEGFIGGAVSTLIFGFLVSNELIKHPYFTCPPTDFNTSFWSDVSCIANPVFRKQGYTIPSNFPYIGGSVVMIAPLQFHVIVLSLFASSIAPFGGFFASGLKRAFKIKDFGDVIPGHGGITDRFDCQFIMGTFSYIYVTSFVGRIGAGEVIRGFLQLTREEQEAVLSHILSYMNELE